MTAAETTRETEAQVAELVARVRRIRITASRAVNDLFAGEYHSAFRGRGMEFDEVREYQPGDDVRTIDWNVTARAGTPFVKRYREERELTLVLLVDVSASGAFGSQDRTKADLLVEVAALLLFSALRNHDKVGLLLFCDDVLRYFPPRKGRGPMLRLLRELVAAKPKRAPTNLGKALEFLGKVQRRRAVVFVLSDFLDQDPVALERSLGLAATRHDVVAISVDDPRERELPKAGLVAFEDAETGERIAIDTSSRAVREAYAARGARREAALAAVLRRASVDRLALATDEPYETTLHRFFRMRERRLSR
jgi:uncharacterized protein (DUF58 family)